MNGTKYTLPGMPGWTFVFGQGMEALLYNKSSGFKFGENMSADEIVEGVKQTLQRIGFKGDEAAISTIAEASRNIDWKKTKVKPLPDLVAVLINEPPVIADAEKMIPADELDKIYSELEATYYAIKARDPRSKAA